MLFSYFWVSYNIVKFQNQKVNISKDENLTRLLDSFYRDKPKGRRGVPSWNLSLVLHQLTKAPFEPMRKALLKHLTFKTVFLLALGSGKRRSEIHAWLFRNIRHQENWRQVSLHPSPSFLSKNQLARDGPASVAPVVILALSPSLDRSLRHLASEGDTTGPGQSPAQDVFSNVWRDRQGAGQMHLSTR